MTNATVVINVLRNRSPRFIDVPYSFSLSERTVVGTSVYDVTAVDDDLEVGALALYFGFSERHQDDAVFKVLDLFCLMIFIIKKHPLVINRVNVQVLSICACIVQPPNILGEYRECPVLNLMLNCFRKTHFLLIECKWHTESYTVKVNSVACLF